MGDTPMYLYVGHHSPSLLLSKQIFQTVRLIVVTVIRLTRTSVNLFDCNLQSEDASTYLHNKALVPFKA
jgi:hypothetical protein